jgi:hypothetical protein
MKVGKREDLENGLVGDEQKQRIKSIKKLLRKWPIGHERQHLRDGISDAQRKLGR